MHNDRFICNIVHVMYMCVVCIDAGQQQSKNYMCHLTSDILEAGISWQRNVPICNESLLWTWEVETLSYF